MKVAIDLWREARGDATLLLVEEDMKWKDRRRRFLKKVREAIGRMLEMEGMKNREKERK